MRIIITGGAGYKGLKLAPQLLARGHHVTILDNFMYGYDSALFLFNYPNVAFVQKDIRNIAEKDIANFDIIIHLAGISGYPACESNPNSAQMINVVATQKMVSLLSVNQILINAATTSSYGQSGQECDETTAISPVSLYGVTKYEAEKICMDRENSISLRFATIFGISPRMRWDLLPNDFVMRAMHERSLVLFGSQSVRTFLHIDDAVRSYIMAVERSQDMRGEVYNVGSNSMNYSKKQLAEKIKQYVEFVIIDSSLPDPDVRHFFINFDKIESLGFKAEKNLDEGIQELIKLFSFYRPHRPYNII
jgi:nucleoside-diphosphate-sugar epimerase